MEAEKYWEGGGQEKRQRVSPNNKYRYNEAINSIGTDPNDPLASSPGSDNHRLTMSKLGGTEAS